MGKTAKDARSRNAAAENSAVVCDNKKAFANYEFSEHYEAGLVLTGTEVKSLRERKAQLADAYVDFQKGEAFVVNMHIAPYGNAFYDNHQPLRPRKLLLHKKEIDRLRGKVEQRGFSLIPTRLYFKEGRAKLQISLGRGKKDYDKRESIRRRDEQRIAEREEKIKRRR